MQISFKLERADYILGQYSHYWQRSYGPFLTILNNFVYPLIGVAGMAEWIHHASRHPDPHRSIVIPAFCVLLCAIPLIQYFQLRRLYKRTRGSGEKCTIDFREENIYAEIPGHSRTTLEWAAAIKYYEGKKTILVYVGTTRFLIVPKRYLTPLGQEELLSLLQRKIATGSSTS